MDNEEIAKQWLAEKSGLPRSLKVTCNKCFEKYETDEHLINGGHVVCPECSQMQMAKSIVQGAKI